MSLGALACVVTVPAEAQAAPAYRKVDLGAGDNSEARAINARGHVVGERAGRPFLLVDGQFVDLLPAGGQGRANDVNNRDEVVGCRFSADSPARAFLWRRGVLTDLPGFAPGDSCPNAINDHGIIVGISAGRAVRWVGGRVSALGEWGGTANDINNAGVAVGYQEEGWGPAPVLWRRDGQQRRLSTKIGMAYAINDRGDVAGVFDRATQGFLWHRGRLTDLVPPPRWNNIMPAGLNNRGQLVGNTSPEPFVWQRGRFTQLPQAPMGSSRAYDINDRGLIVGTSAERWDGHNPRAVLWTR